MTARLASALLALAVVSRVAHAHPLPETRAWLDIVPGGARLLLHIPLNRLEFAVGRPLADHPGSLMQRDSADLSRYLLQHIGARSGNVGWQVLAPQLTVIGTDRRAELVANMELRAPAGVDARDFTLLYDAVTHEVRTHRVEVLLRNDWSAGIAAQTPQLLGELRYEVRTLDVSLDAPRTGGAWASLLRGGAWHIAEGTDHLLFLLMLLLVAPITSSHGRWGERRDARTMRRALFAVVSGFTVGHSITLTLGSTGLLTPPAQWVEVGVAVTIVLAAMHAMRPLFLRAEAAMALGLGLIHGLAFSSSLNGAGLSAWQHAQALLAFNIGIEAMQLLIVAAVLPLLLLLLHQTPRGYAALRLTLAGGGALAAMAWVVERSGVEPLTWFAR